MLVYIDLEFGVEPMVKPMEDMELGEVLDGMVLDLFKMVLLEVVLSVEVSIMLEVHNLLVELV